MWPGKHAREAARSHVRVHAAELNPQASSPGDTARAKTPSISAFEVLRDAPTAPEIAPAKETNGAGNGSASAAEAPVKSMKRGKRKSAEASVDSIDVEPSHSPLLMVTKPLPRVLILHTGGTLGMDPTMSYEAQETGVTLKPGTGGVYAGAPSALRPQAAAACMLSLPSRVAFVCGDRGTRCAALRAVFGNPPGHTLCCAGCAR